MLWTWLGNLIAGPILDKALGKALDAYKANLAAGNTSERIAADLAAREVQLQQRELELQAQVRISEIGHPFEPDKLMAYCVAVYFGKLLVWDKVLGLGTTDPLGGFASVTANLIVSFYFARRGIENVARILKR